jgi:methylenetetrahydrofolate reductase (NADPH)
LGRLSVSRLEERLAAGQFVVTAEMPTIDGGGLGAVRFQLEPMAPYLDAANATDNTAAHAHASPLSVSIGLQQLGMEPIMQLVCRDRNRLALEADLAGAAMHGIENICCLTGDDVTAGDEPETKRVFDLDGIQLIALTRSLAAGHYLSGRPLTPAPHFVTGAVENPSAPPVEYRVRRAAKKARAGARFLQLQLCYRPELLERFMAGVHERGVSARCAMLPSICMVGSANALRFVDERVPGVEVPQDVLARIEAADDQHEECFDLACEQARHALSLPGVAGIHLISFRKDAGIARLCQRLGIPPRAEREQHGYRPSLAV